MKKLALIILGIMSINASAQQVLSPELLLKLGRVSVLGISKDGKNIVYKVSTPVMEDNKSTNKFYTIPVNGGTATEVKDTEDLVTDKNISPDGKYILSSEEVKTEKILGKDYYPSLEKSDVQIYNGLDYRHWDTWNNGTHNHVFYAENKEKATTIDIMKGENYDAPQSHLVVMKIIFGRQTAKASFMFAKRKKERRMQFLPIPICMNTIWKAKPQKT